MIRVLGATLAVVLSCLTPRLALAQEDRPVEGEGGGGTIVVQPVDETPAEDPLPEMADSPSAREATGPRTPEAFGPMIHPGAVFKNGYYRGVVPGENHLPPKARRLKRTRRNFVTWPGFELLEHGSRIFVQSTRPVTYRRIEEPNRIVLVLENTRIHLRNNLNPLVTAHFNTPVAEAYLRRHRRHTHLVLEMKVGVEPAIRQVSENGYHFLFLEFPPGNYPIPTQIRRGYHLSDRLRQRKGGENQHPKPEP